MKTNYPNSLKILLFVTIINYLAQVPYYLINDYFPYHILPSTRGVILLGLTFIWFLIGYVGTIKKKYVGYIVLVSYLIIEGLFYVLTIVFGAFIFQLQHPNSIIKVVFIIGYISGMTSLYYACVLIRNKPHYLNKLQ